MDYKYIEQLLERYWECQTTLEEEAILRTFFRQEDVPASLLPYRQLFIEEDEMAEECLSKDFTDKMLHLVGEDAPMHVCKARRVTFMRRCRPFYRVAGLVAILLTIGNAAHQSFTDEGQQSTDNAQPSMANTQWSMVDDSVESRPEQQSAELTLQPVDTIKTLPK
ncbi:MAG: pyruvate ferredoxin oxidoreductase [Bacteroidaceae bacterium]|nr:pyruvate ferredoxin oxidoreductase [Bacteroidaceae bacterium]